MRDMPSVMPSRAPLTYRHNFRVPSHNIFDFQDVDATLMRRLSLVLAFGRFARGIQYWRHCEGQTSDWIGMGRCRSDQRESSGAMEISSE